MNRSEIQKIVLSGFLVAVGVILAKLIHGFMGFRGGGMLLPMHIPVLLCGFFCGAKYGMLCGFLTPLISSLVSGMPAGDTLLAMLFELPTYGLFAGLLSNDSFRPISSFFSNNLKDYVHILLSLIGSMLIGRGVWGVVKTIILSRGDTPFTFIAFLTGAFITAFIGVVIQIVIIPPIVLMFKKSKISKQVS